jgi:hypothetical protein
LPAPARFAGRSPAALVYGLLRFIVAKWRFARPAGARLDRSNRIAKVINERQAFDNKQVFCCVCPSGAVSRRSSRGLYCGAGRRLLHNNRPSNSQQAGGGAACFASAPSWADSVRHCQFRRH